MLEYGLCAPMWYISFTQASVYYWSILVSVNLLFVLRSKAVSCFAMFCDFFAMMCDPIYCVSTSAQSWRGQPITSPSHHMRWDKRGNSRGNGGQGRGNGG